MNCEFCQSPVHIWFQCPKKPDGWKPARLANKNSPAMASEQGGQGSSPDALGRVITPGTPVKFDKKAWMRDYMREYMRKRRAAE